MQYNVEEFPYVYEVEISYWCVKQPYWNNLIDDTVNPMMVDIEERNLMNEDYIAKNPGFRSTSLRNPEVKIDFTNRAYNRDHSCAFYDLKMYKGKTMFATGSSTSCFRTYVNTGSGYELY